MAPKLNLFLAPGACSLAPHILLREAGLPYTTTTISYSTGFLPEYLKLNPKGKVPFMQMDDAVITETPAIMTAIAQLAPTKHFLGKTNLETVRCYEWMNWLSGTLHGQAFGGLFRPERFVTDAALVGAVSEKARETIAGCYAFIEERLQGKTWAVGEDFSAVDAYLFVFWRWGNMKGFEMREKYPEYTALVERVAEREKVRETVEEEGVGMWGT